MTSKKKLHERIRELEDEVTHLRYLPPTVSTLEVDWEARRVTWRGRVINGADAPILEVPVVTYDPLR